MCHVHILRDNRQSPVNLPVRHKKTANKQASQLICSSTMKFDKDRYYFYQSPTPNHSVNTDENIVEIHCAITAHCCIKTKCYLLSVFQNIPFTMLGNTVQWRIWKNPRQATTESSNVEFQQCLLIIALATYDMRLCFEITKLLRNMGLQETLYVSYINILS